MNERCTGCEGCPGGAASAGVLGAVMAGILTLFGRRHRGNAQRKNAQRSASGMKDADRDAEIKA